MFSKKLRNSHKSLPNWFDMESLLFFQPKTCFMVSKCFFFVRNVQFTLESLLWVQLKTCFLVSRTYFATDAVVVQVHEAAVVAFDLARVDEALRQRRAELDVGGAAAPFPPGRRLQQPRLAITRRPLQLHFYRSRLKSVEYPLHCPCLSMIITDKTLEGFTIVDTELDVDGRAGLY